MGPVVSTRRWGRIGLSLRDLDPPVLVLSTAYSRKIRKVKISARAARCIGLMRQTRSLHVLRSGSGVFPNYMQPLTSDLCFSDNSSPPCGIFSFVDLKPCP